ncbi:MAG: hypothetical protein ACRYHQ_24265 [Janthinobacterium lividum]
MDANIVALIAAGVGAICTGASSVLVSRNKVRVAEASLARTSSSSDSKVAFDNLLVVVDALRKELAEVRAELDEERGARKVADHRAYALREEVHGLRTVLQINGVVAGVPPMTLA